MSREREKKCFIYQYHRKTISGYRMDNRFKFSLPSEFPKNSVTLQVLHKEEHKDEKGHEILQGILQSPRQALVGDRTTLSTYLILDMILLATTPSPVVPVSLHSLSHGQAIKRKQ